MLKTIPRTAVDRYLKLVRAPADAVLGRREGERAKALKLRIDRADAAARAAAGTALRDDSLKQDARRRREAADERGRAQRLRGVALEHREEAEQTASEMSEKADERRKRAEQDASQQEKRARKRRAAAKKAAATRAEKRKQTAAATAAKADQQTEKRTRREKLDALESKDEALAEKEEALVAADERERLKEAAAAAKAKRKSNGSGS